MTKLPAARLSLLIALAILSGCKKEAPNKPDITGAVSPYGAQGKRDENVTPATAVAPSPDGNPVMANVVSNKGGDSATHNAPVNIVANTPAVSVPDNGNLILPLIGLLVLFTFLKKKIAP